MSINSGDLQTRFRVESLSESVMMTTGNSRTATVAKLHDLAPGLLLPSPIFTAAVLPLRPGSKPLVPEVPTSSHRLSMHPPTSDFGLWLSHLAFPWQLSVASWCWPRGVCNVFMWKAHSLHVCRHHEDTFPGSGLCLQPQTSTHVAQMAPRLE